jgi:NAD(P)H-dependent FMN reductase
LTFKETIKSHDAIIIATPEYIHNIPAVLKNALEWTTQTGEFSNKKTLAISYTPHPPRGKYAMSSLINSLNALDANVVASLDLYHDSVKGNHFNSDTTELLKEALKLLE